MISANADGERRGRRLCWRRRGLMAYERRRWQGECSASDDAGWRLY